MGQVKAQGYVGLTNSSHGRPLEGIFGSISPSHLLCDCGITYPSISIKSHGSVIGKSDVIVMPDYENTLMHAEESRSKIIAKQNDPQMIEKKVITKPIDYAILNQLSSDFHTRFVPQTESYAEQDFWSQYSVQTDEPTHSGTTIVEVPKELPKQMELAVEQHCTEKTKFQTKMENVLNENDRLLTHSLSVEIVNIVVHDCMNVNCLNVDACEHCVTTESELKTDFIKKECYETLLQ
nr:hypothetical protein [Tanacetum cinerariifolium]